MYMKKLLSLAVIAFMLWPSSETHAGYALFSQRKAALEQQRNSLELRKQAVQKELEGLNEEIRKITEELEKIDSIEKMSSDIIPSFNGIG